MNKLSFKYPFGHLGRIIALCISSITTLIILFWSLFMIHMQIEFLKTLFVLFILGINLIYDNLLLRSKDIWYDEKGIYIKINKEKCFIGKKEILKFQRRFFFFYEIYFKESEANNNKFVFFIGPNAPIERLPAIKELMKK